MINVTAEISVFPLSNNYGNDVVAFLKHLRANCLNLQMRTNGMSTYLQGELRAINECLELGLEAISTNDNTLVVNIKIITDQVDLNWRS